MWDRSPDVGLANPGSSANSSGGDVLPLLVAAGAALQYEGQKQAGRLAGQQANRERAMQETFAKQGLRWKMEDARAAGIHPLAALGASGASYSPISVGDTGGGTALADLGQNIQRAAHATRTSDERKAATLATVAAEKQIEGLDLDNRIKASELARMNQTGPAFPGGQSFIPGQGNSNLISQKPLERIASAPGAAHSEAGAVNDVGWAKTPTGLVPIPSSDFKQRAEDMMVPELMHSIRNNLMPNFGGGSAPPLPGDWEWNPLKQEYQPADYKTEGFFDRLVDVFGSRRSLGYKLNTRGRR